jgi:hypothetical protein
MVGVMMRGTDETSGSLFGYVDLEERIPARHPLRNIRQVVNDALASLDAEFEALYTDFGRPRRGPRRACWPTRTFGNAALSGRTRSASDQRHCSNPTARTKKLLDDAL